jgi:hypothetical protein
MTDEEWVALVWPWWRDDWLTTGSQVRRAELLAAKDRIEALTGWTWAPPFAYDNPPRIALTGGTDG